MMSLRSCVIISCFLLATGSNLMAQPAAGNTAAAVLVHAFLPEVGPLPSPPLPHEAELIAGGKKRAAGRFPGAMQQLGALQKTSTDPRIYYLAPLFQSVTALIAAGGARRVVASLWKADEDAGLRMMVAFHGALAREPSDPAGALQRAKLTIAASPEHQPHLWATYTLFVRDLAAIRIDVP